MEVTLLKEASTARLAVHSPYRILDLKNGTSLREGASLPSTPVALKQGQLALGGIKLGTNGVRVVAQVDGTLELEGTHYRGEIHLLKGPKGGLTAIDKLDVESYILGVVGSEMPNHWEPEALSAQAITARTFALYLKGNGVNLGALHLAYKGTTKETPALRRIVSQTRGVVMLYKKDLFPAYFHSTCGGHTEDANLVFGKDGIPPLKGVKCNYCKDSKYYQWSREISKQELEKDLGKAYPSLKEIWEVSPQGRGPGRHVSQVEIKYASGSYRMNANEFRLLLGPNHLLSTAFEVADKGKTIRFSGNGWGHGVGLCQYGAGTMAKNGSIWQEILKKYYPGVEFVKIYE
ncbi:MAG: SpoIID/LytB domain-containing protein [Candidatus Brocadiaceae bacterium]|nr:SpoIID/LytB domain-containing protein [Candidatus Brocadiaceae bacterium]